MIFNSIEFFIFLPVALLAFYLVSAKYRWVLLLLLSYVFYAGWKVEFLGLIIYSTVVDYFIAKGIYQTKKLSTKKGLVALSLFSNFGVLILFKYFHFFIGGSEWFKALANSSESVLWLQFIFEYGIPVGISFYTFQTVSYTIDVYRGEIEPERNIAKFALFVSFFPQLVAGPIERFSNLHHQLFNNIKVRLDDMKRSFRLALYGFFLKLAIADNIATIVNPIFESDSNYTIISKSLAIVGFGFQIYADFFGYTLIAIAIAGLFGVRLQPNFNSPYGSYSIREFWSKWHISLSNWFRDYVYIPLGGSKSNKVVWLKAILVTFLISGLWHGASANFLWWGLIHGVLYVLEQLMFPINRDKIRTLEKSVRWFITFILVMISWAFFRATDMTFIETFFEQGSHHITKDVHVITVVPILCFLFLEILFRRRRIDSQLDNSAPLTRWIIYTILLASILLFSSTGSMDFIYFQF